MATPTTVTPFAGFAPVTLKSGCQQVRAVAADPILEVDTGPTGTEIVVWSDSTNIKTRLVREDLEGPNMDWEAEPGLCTSPPLHAMRRCSCPSTARARSPCAWPETPVSGQQGRRVAGEQRHPGRGLTGGGAPAPAGRFWRIGKRRCDEDGPAGGPTLAPAPPRHGVTVSTLPAWPSLVPVAWAVFVVGIILGPALGGGVVLTYDLVWSPDSRLTPFSTGIGTPVPRAVPSDSFAWFLGLVVTPSLAQKLMLVTVLMLAALGAVALLRHLSAPGCGPLAACAVALASVWNPSVSERLVVGQWTVLLGYALLPWGLRATSRAVAGEGSRRALALIVGVAGIGGVNTVLMVCVGVLAALLAGLAVNPRRAVTSTVVVLATAIGVSAAWLVPSLAAGATVDRSGVRAFAPVADTPWGVWGSLVSGGGFWNAAAHPVQRDVRWSRYRWAPSVAASSASVSPCRRTRHGLLMAPVLVGVGVVALSCCPSRVTSGPGSSPTCPVVARSATVTSSSLRGWSRRRSVSGSSSTA